MAGLARAGGLIGVTDTTGSTDWTTGKAPKQWNFSHKAKVSVVMLAVCSRYSDRLFAEAVAALDRLDAIDREFPEPADV